MKRVITSKPPSIGAYVREIFRQWRFIFFLARRDLKIKYAQSVLGIAWSALQPLAGLLIYSLFFGFLIKLDTGVDYPLFAFPGIIAWYLFSYIVHQSGTALLQSQDILRKIYFPRLIVPLSKVAVGVVEFGIALVLLLGYMFITGHYPIERILLLPLVLVLNVAAGLAIAIWLSALTVRYRDMQHIIPYLVNFGIWLTPVFYPSTLIPEKWAAVLHFNPMAAVVESYRWCLYDAPLPDPQYAWGLAIVALLLGSGVYYFRSIDHRISEWI